MWWEAWHVTIIICNGRVVSKMDRLHGPTSSWSNAAEIGETKRCEEHVCSILLFSRKSSIFESRKDRKTSGLK